MQREDVEKIWADPDDENDQQPMPAFNPDVVEASGASVGMTCQYDPEPLKNLAVDVSELKDLFRRRLMEDKQKTELIKTLSSAASFAVIEPFLVDIILVLDRIEKSTDEFVCSIHDELLETLQRRGVKRVDVSGGFDPAIHQAVRRESSDEVQSISILQVVRNGYLFGGRVLRPAEVVVAVPAEGTALPSKDESTPAELIVGVESDI